MPWPSIGEKLPLVTSPAGLTVDLDGLLGSRGPAAFGGDAPQPPPDAPLALGGEGVATEERALVPAHHPTEPGLQ